MVQSRVVAGIVDGTWNLSLTTWNLRPRLLDPDECDGESAMAAAAAVAVVPKTKTTTATTMAARNDDANATMGRLVFRGQRTVLVIRVILLRNLRVCFGLRAERGGGVDQWRC